MSMNVFATSGVLATVLGLASGATAWSGYDPPADKQIQSSQRKDDGSTPTALDAVTPMVVPAVIEELLRQAGEALIGRSPPSEMEKETQAVRLFKIAESCRAKREYEKARICYQRVHMLMPTSPFGRLAIDRLSEVEERMRATYEEQDVPEDDESLEQSFRDIQENSIPLGLVVVSY